MKNIASALVKAQRGFAPALKTSTNPHFKSRYVDLAGCVEAVIDSLNANGVFLMQPSHESANGVTIETIFIHESGEQISAGKLFVPASKQDAQGFGSALTYARRYSLMAACGIAPEDDDGNAATKSAPRPSNQSAKSVAAATLESLEESAPGTQDFLRELADSIDAKETASEMFQAYSTIKATLTSDEQVGLWGFLPSNVRSAIKREGEKAKSVTV